MGALLLPAREEDRCRLAGWFRELLAGRPDAVDWAHERAASDLAKKLVVASEQGVAWISVGSIADAALWQQPAFEAAAGLSAWGGLLGPEAGAVRPVFVALQQLMQSGADRVEVERVDVEPAEARVYALGAAAWVAWYDPPRLALPGDPTLRRILALPVPTPRARVETLGAAPVPAAPAAPGLEAEQGAVRLELTARPILVIPEP